MSTWFWARVAAHRLIRRIEWTLHPRPWAVTKGDVGEFRELVAARASPLKRAPDGAIAAHSDEKAHNLRIAARGLDRLVIAPGHVFSFCRTVGKTTARQGYLPALELIEGNLRPETGGGLCQLSNLLFLLAVDINAEIVERHRHSFDLFRDVERTVPFGCGATVFYNYVDFQFRNTLALPVMLIVKVEPPRLTAEVRAPQPLPFTVRLIETDHRFFRRDAQVFRANRIWKEIEPRDGGAPVRELLMANECRVLYPADDLVSDE